MPCILTRCRVFILTGCNTAPYKRLQRVLPIYTAHAAKQRTGLYSRFSCDCAHSTTHDTRPTQVDIIPPVPRWRAYTRPDTLNRYQAPPPHRDAAQLSTAAYYNNVYKRVQGCVLLWIHARQRSIQQTIPAAAGQRLPCADRWQVLHPAHLLRGSASPHVQRSARHTPSGWAVQQQGRGGAARNHWRLPPHFFSGFRPIANRGQQ